MSTPAAKMTGACLRLRPRVGEHVVAGTTLAWVWRAAPGDQPVVTADCLTVDLAAKRVTRDGQDARLTPTEWQLLEVLVRRDRLVAQRHLLHEVWGQQ